MNKDEQLTYEELTKLCRKQEEYIKELEKKIKDITPSDTEKCCMPRKETYEELEWDRDNLREQLRNNDKLIFVLEKSLTKINEEAMYYKQEVEWYQQQNYELRKQLNDK